MTHSFISDWGCIQGRIVPKPSFGFHALSIAQYFCTMVARSAKRVTLRRLMAFMIPLSVQLLQKIEIALSSRQSFILFITRRNLAQ